MCLCKVGLEKAWHRGRFDDRGGGGDMTMEADTGVMRGYRSRYEVASNNFPQKL